MYYAIIQETEAELRHILGTKVEEVKNLQKQMLTQQPIASLNSTQQLLEAKVIMITMCIYMHATPQIFNSCPQLNNQNSRRCSHMVHVHLSMIIALLSIF